MAEEETVAVEVKKPLAQDYPSDRLEDMAKNAFTPTPDEGRYVDVGRPARDEPTR